MSGEVTVTGFGVRTAFGTGADALRRGVFAGVPAFTPTTRFDTGPYRTPMAAAAPDGPDAVEGWALRHALAECGTEGLDMAGLPSGTEAAVLLGTVGDTTSITHHWQAAAGSAPGAGEAMERAADAVPAHLAEQLAGGLGLTGPRLTFTNACVASAAAIIHACRLISSGRIDVAVCAGAYLVEEATFGKFDSGRALSRDGMVRPFSVDRSGLLLGDGVAVVVLESAEHARRRGARPLVNVVGWGAATDAHHIAQPHPEGAGLAAAARQALRLAGDADGSTLGYVNAHGTGTKYNDAAETRGLRAAFPERAESIPVSSTKGTTGHLLQAAGVVEFVITMLAVMDGVLPPTAGFTRPDPECDLDYVPNSPRPADLRRALTINAAFGGANTALVLERP
ncbi:beta-ketoacyl-[acyl-carrier-protein] synthase family protein [Streptomyces neyagawaensis]|uniref:beta-ketoacyl-[acyl-carrier-protein] synthase family protein n=1 Tax=Streptomyces neyagawaensis TaxID=42238 RepID=UPI0006E1D8F8|nr:beta-ketoacyl-[acyl-carrier-protein] synthase family protein [Streptomyces neyagawaensis]MCL6733674.1 beta-ketoacyl-[acyl-carrier-protein] synthase family protein [Streptomyces neyagawaensis]MDE1683903.1 beta-ketoacyl-[acyl-carrier-protein] synthase family protein [Streptomyces neyagawaensis]